MSRTDSHGTIIVADALLKRIREFFTGNDGVRTVAGDPAISAELLLLFRVIMADGKVTDEEMGAFAAICENAFGIAPDDIPAVLEYLNDAGYETTGRQALAVFEDMDAARKAELISHMATIARVDSDVDQRELDLVKRASAALGLRV